MALSKIETNSLANTAVIAGEYGNTNTAISMTINEKGQVTRVANVAIAGVSGGGGSSESGFNPFLLAGM